MKKAILILFIIPLLSFTLIHKYYVALTEIQFNKEKKSVELIMNVFMDDIEESLKKEYEINPQIASQKELTNIDTYYAKYLVEHFKININNKVKKFNFLGKEYDGNIVYFYFEIDNISSIQTIEIENTMLVKQFPDQQNLIKAKVNEKSKSLFLTKKNDKGLLNF